MSCISVLTTEDDIISDHKLVACELDIDVPKKPDPSPHYVLPISHMDTKQLNERLKDFQWTEVYRDLTPAEQKDRFVFLFKEKMYESGASWINANFTNKYINNLFDKQRKIRAQLKYCSDPNEKKSKFITKLTP